VKAELLQLASAETLVSLFGDDNLNIAEEKQVIYYY
jgi:hypothetical protein